MTYFLTSFTQRRIFLRAELRDKLVNYFHAGDQGVRVADLLDERGRLKPADFTDQVL